MENLGTYFLIVLAIAFVIYYSNKKKTGTPKAKAPAKPRAAASKPNTKKPQPKKGGQTPKKEEKATETSSLLSTGLGTSKGKLSGSTSSLSELDLMAELSIESMGIGDSKSQGPSKVPSSPVATTNFDLEKEVKQLQARTGWDYAKAKAYCEQALEYQKKIATPARLKKSN
jgi:hypothetical protein